MNPRRPSIALVFALVGAASCSSGRPAVLPAASAPPTGCSRGFEGTFIQLHETELDYGYPEWRRVFELFQSLSIETVVLQYTGDEHGPYDARRPGRAPVRSLLEAADDADIEVFVGLFSDPAWPNTVDLEGLPPPLRDERETRRLDALCRAHRSCRGWYLPQEIDDLTWGEAPKTLALRAWLDKTAGTLRSLASERPIAIAPFFTKSKSPGERAAFWAELLRNRPVDIVMVQDGIGAGHGDVGSLGPALSALRPITDSRGIELWSVLELFEQLHGPPGDRLPFEARSASFSRVLSALWAQKPYVNRTIAFSVLDYMASARSAEAANLHSAYIHWCR